MKTNIALKVTLAVMVIFVAGLQAQAESIVTEREDGAVELNMNGQQVLITAAVAESVTAAVRDHADDPQALRQAIQAIVAEHAGEPGDAELATAIAALAIYRTRARSASADAIIRGASAGNPGVPAGSLLTILPSLKAHPLGQTAGERQLAQLQATVENPSQVSQVSLAR